jgi:hypothetical protein
MNEEEKLWVILAADILSFGYIEEAYSIVAG